MINRQRLIDVSPPFKIRSSGYIPLLRQFLIIDRSLSQANDLLVYWSQLSRRNVTVTGIIWKILFHRVSSSLWSLLSIVHRRRWCFLMIFFFSESDSQHLASRISMIFSISSYFHFYLIIDRFCRPTISSFIDLNYHLTINNIENSFPSNPCTTVNPSSVHCASRRKRWCFVLDLNLWIIFFFEKLPIFEDFFPSYPFSTLCFLIYPPPRGASSFQLISSNMIYFD